MITNEKALVTKELNAKHAKILLDLLKLPENKECADCRSKAPGWASINLGIFICMRCSGIHRSLGVHISKVRSTTLDTWLPEQVAFMQAVGNQKANEYWEAELPMQFFRHPNEIESFIRAKYVDKRWASVNSPMPEMTSTITTPTSTSTITSISTRKEIPKKARRYSMDEGFFSSKEMPRIAPPKMHTRTGSLDMMDSSARAINSSISLGGKDVGDAGMDLFSLLYVSQETQDHHRAVVPPSRWATFDPDN